MLEARRSGYALDVPRYRLTLAYDGTNFCGWQKQEPLAAHVFARQTKTDAKPADQQPARDTGTDPMPHSRPPVPVSVPEWVLEPLAERPDRVALRTVQHVVERAVMEVVRERVELIGASRTDSGVHAHGQVAAFTCSGDECEPGRRLERSDGGWPLERGAERLRRAINGRLPEDVLVLDCAPAPRDFNPIADCTSKAYSYTLHASGPGGQREMFDRAIVHQVWDQLNLDAMNAAAERLVGEHDFAAFAAAGHGRQTTVRTVLSCQVRDLGAPAHGLDPSARRLRIEVSGTGFLYNMVRIISGTLLEAGRGRLSPDDVAAALASGDRRRAGPTLPPQGLCLEWIKYDRLPNADESTRMDT